MQSKCNRTSLPKLWQAASVSSQPSSANQAETHHESSAYTQVKVSPRSQAGAQRLRLAVCLLIVYVTATQAQNSPKEAATSVAPFDPPVPSSDQLNETTAPTFVEPAATSTSSNLYASVKLKPINFTLVDEVFDSVLSDEEVAKRWRIMDSQIQEGVKSILKMVFPQIVAISQDAKVSGDCSGGILKWILSLRNLRSWAIKMLDATGKPTAGIFQGSLNMLGNYRQCLSVRAPDEDEIEITEQFEEYFRGQFCAIHLRPWMPAKPPYYHLNLTIESLLRRGGFKYYEKTLYDDLAEIAVAFNFIDIRFDLCVPSTCSMADIQRVADLLSRKVEMRSKVVRCDIAPRDTSLARAMDRATYFWSLVPLLMVVIAIVATVLSILGPTGDQSVDISSNRGGFKSNLQSLSIVHCLVDRWHVCRERLGGCCKCKGIELEQNQKEIDSSSSTTGTDLSATRDSYLVSQAELSTSKPVPLYGLRCILVLWFIIVQMTVELKYQYLRESLPLRDMLLSYWPFQIIINSVFVYESFILVTAFAYGYSCLEFTLRRLVSYIMDKYIRLILPIVTLVAVVTFTPLLAIESPNWHNFVEEQSSVCKSNGLFNLLFLQNFISYDNMCLPQTWLLCVEFQLIVLSMPVVLLLKKTFLSTEDLVIIGRETESSKNDGPVPLLKVILWRAVRSKAGLLVLLLTLLGVGVNFFYVYLNQLPPSWFYTFPDQAQKSDYFSRYFTKTWTHLSVFIVGLVGGHLCRGSIKLRGIRAAIERQRASGSANSGEAQQWSPSLDSSVSSKLTISTRVSVSTIMSMEQHKSSDIEVRHSPGSDKSKRPASPLTRALESYLQAAALASMAALIFSTYSWSTGRIPNALVSALYDSLSRLTWSLALVAIMVQLCLSASEASSKWPTAVRLLSAPACVRLGRLSYLAFLLTPYVNTFILAVTEQAIFPSLFLIFHFIVGNIVIIYTLALIWAISIEQPIRRLCRSYLSAE